MPKKLYNKTYPFESSTNRRKATGIRSGVACILSYITLLAGMMIVGLNTSMAQLNTLSDGVEIKKGLYFSSLNFSLGDRKAENESQLFTYMVYQKKSQFELRLDPGYIVKNNLGVGAGLLYGRSSDNNQQRASDGTITDIKFAKSYFAFRPFVKNFIPLGKSHRFYIIIPTELQIGYGSSVKESTTAAVLTRTFTKTNFYGIALRPGLLVFVVKNFGFEVNVGAFGLNQSVEKSNITGQPDSKVTTRDLDLKINILDLSLGFSAYF